MLRTIALLAVMMCIKNISAQGDCRTALGETGRCTYIRECPAMAKLLHSVWGDHSAMQYLRKSRCGWGSGKFCCPQEEGQRDCTTERPSWQSSEPSCGKTVPIDRPRIINGQPAKLGAWPWIAALGYVKKVTFYRRSNCWRYSNKINWICGASLITSRHLITAAHCTNHQCLRLKIARIGELNLDPEIQDGANPVNININKIIVHEKYNPNGNFNDIALLRLEKSAIFSDLIRPVCLPTSKSLQTQDFINYQPFVAGWGKQEPGAPSKYSTQLMEVQIPIISNQKCQSKYGRTANITRGQLCAGLPYGGKDSCQGDSGGPMILPVGDTFYLIGVVSFGKGCAEADFPGVYTRVTEYTDWIKDNFNK